MEVGASVFNIPSKRGYPFDFENEFSGVIAALSVLLQISQKNFKIFFFFLRAGGGGGKKFYNLWRTKHKEF
ncbi:MAG: hypothetical protein IPQ23_09380 [Cytophagaceae bacterium]|nr:hypothetical protein [Cytophagaceae bacterium]